MSEERREHPRLAHPIDGSWKGASGATRCRISDISPKGCFIQSLAAPVVGGLTTVTIEFDPDRPVVVTGKVAYTESGMGFAVEFVDVTDETTKAIDELMDAVKQQPAG
jgi:hypothetical protein